MDLDETERNLELSKNASQKKKVVKFKNNSKVSDMQQSNTSSKSLNSTNNSQEQKKQNKEKT